MGSLKLVDHLRAPCILQQHRRPISPAPAIMGEQCMQSSKMQAPTFRKSMYPYCRAQTKLHQSQFADASKPLCMNMTGRPLTHFQ